MNEDDVIADLARSDELSGALARGEVGEPEKRGRGRPHKPAVPPPSWPAITGTLEMTPWAFKRCGEVIEADTGRVPTKPATFIYARR